MKNKAALEAVEFAKQMQSGKLPITDENIDKLCKMAGVKLYRNVDVTRRNGRMIPTRTRRTKEGSSYLSANMAAKFDRGADSASGRHQHRDGSGCRGNNHHSSSSARSRERDTRANITSYSRRTNSS